MSDSMQTSECSFLYDLHCFHDDYRSSPEMANFGCEEFRNSSDFVRHCNYDDYRCSTEILRCGSNEQRVPGSFDDLNEIDASLYISQNSSTQIIYPKKSSLITGQSSVESFAITKPCSPLCADILDSPNVKDQQFSTSQQTYSDVSDAEMNTSCEAPDDASDQLDDIWNAIKTVDSAETVETKGKQKNFQ